MKTSMKVPKTVNTYCKKCKKYAIHTISLYKKGKQRNMSIGARRHAEDKKGYGGQKFPELVRTAKTTKKQVLILKCKNCNLKRMKEGIRLRKLEIEA